MKRAAVTNLAAKTTAWAASLMILNEGIYSMSRIGVDPVNVVVAALGAGQIALALKWRRIAFKVVGWELLLAQPLLLAYFSAPSESNTPRIDLPTSWMFGLYFFLMITSLLLAKICLDEGAGRLLPRDTTNTT